MQNQIKGYRKLADAMLGITLVIEQARAAKSRRKRDELMQNASGRAVALGRLFNDYAEAIAEAESRQTAKH